MRSSFSKIVACLLVAMLIIFPPFSLSAADRAEITDVWLEKEGREVEVSFRLANCFTPKMEEAIQNGVPTTFRIIVAVEKPSVMLLKSPVVDFTLEHTIKYNRLNNEFQVYLQEQPEKTFATRDFNEAKRWMSTVENLPVIHACWLRKDQQYDLKIKAELSKVELPLFLRYILFWVSLWDFETDWKKVTFSM